MMPLTLAEVANHTGGELFGDTTFSHVSTDSRTIRQGDLYVALSGENFDGNTFIGNAANAGACGAVINSSIDVDIPAIKVEDTRLALGLIARTNRRNFTGPVIGLTGSAGKTSTKEMVASILGVKGKVLATHGNLNNEIGVPLTLLEINDSYQYAVVEMGASREGDIAYLTQFSEPTISVLTNAMPAHIESFGDIETIAKTKGEIFECLGSDDVAVINYDDKFFPQWKTQAGGATVVTFSTRDTEADYFSSDYQMLEDGSSQFMLNTANGSELIHLPLLGEHNVANALAAAAATIAAGADLSQVKQGIEICKPVKGRLKTWRSNDKTIIDDSYNASPGAVKAAIDVLAEFSNKRCLVLGTMGELGEDALSFHQQIADYARQKGIEQLVAVGEYALAMIDVFGDGGVAYDQLDQLLVEHETVITASVVLVKGSRSAGMEKLVDVILDRLGVNR